MNYTFNDNFSLGGNVYYTPSFLNSGAEGTYASIVGKAIAPSAWFGASGIGMYVSGEFGRQWLGTSDSFYGTGFTNPVLPDRSRTASTMPTTTPGTSASASPTRCSRWTIRYSDTNLSKGDCNAFTSDFSGPRQHHCSIGYLR